MPRHYLITGRNSEEMTDKLYLSLSFENTPRLMDATEYEEWLKEKTEENKFPEEYKWFLHRKIYYNKKGRPGSTLQAPQTILQFDEIFTEENGRITSRIARNEADIEIAEAIASKNIDVKTFDFDGVKYSSGDVIKSLSN